jgi:hypothetical protein
MVCTSALDIGGGPAHLRHPLLRLRRRLSQAHLLVGTWPTQSPILKDCGRAVRLEPIAAARQG